MKNGLLKSFLVIFILVNLFFFEFIAASLCFLSDLLYSFFDDFDIFCIVLLVLFLIFLGFFIFYLVKHKDKDDIVKVVEFNCPDDLSPLEVGFLVDGVIDDEDLSSMLVYWASKNYIEISNDKKNPKITKLVDKLPEQCKEYEKRMFDGIFLNNKEIYVKQISERLQNNGRSRDAVRSASKIVEQQIGDKYFDKKGMWIRQIFICLISVLFYISLMYIVLEFYDEDVGYLVGIIAVVLTALYVLSAQVFLKYYDYRHKNSNTWRKIVALVFFAVLIGIMIAVSCWLLCYNDDEYDPMIWQLIYLIALIAVMFLVPFLLRSIRIYTEEGVKKLGQVLGFKEYLNAVEKDKIKMLVEENPNVYYDVLPYAFVLGVSEKWIKKLNVISTENPDLIDGKMLGSIAVCTILLTNSKMIFVSVLRFSFILKAIGSIVVAGIGGSRRR